METRIPLTDVTKGEDFSTAPTWVWWCFAALWCGGTWPYQAVLQAENYYVAAFGARTLVLVVLICFTWALLVTYLLLTCFGVSHRFSIQTRVQVSFVLTAGVGLAFVIQDLVGGPDLDLPYKIGIVSGLAVVVGFAQTLCEPALFALAGSLSDARCTQAIMFGNASAGLVVSALAIGSRLISEYLTVDDQRATTRYFFAAEVLSSVVCMVLFRVLIKSAYVKRFGMFIGPRPLPLAGRLRESVAVFPYVAPLALCQFLTFTTTLVLWPAFLAAGCPLGLFARIKGFYFLIIVASYNLADFVARAWPGFLEGFIHRVSVQGMVGCALARLLLLPLIVFTVQPRFFAGELGNWVAIGLSLLLGFSNGTVATSTMMLVPSRCPPQLAAAGVYVTVCFLYLGLATGATLGWVISDNMNPVSC